MINSILNSSAGSLRYYRNGKPVYHGEFISLIRKYADKASEISSSEVLLSTNDTFFFIIGFFALLSSGKKAVIPSFFNSSIQEDTGISAIFTDREIENAVILNDTAEDSPETPIFISGDALLDFYTSGSTGKPKRITKRFANLEAEAVYLSSLFADAIKQAPVFVSTVDVNHMYGIFYNFLLPLYNGLPAETSQILTPEQLQICIERYGKLFLASSPAFLSRVSRYKDEYRFPHNLSAISTAGGVLERSCADEINTQMGLYPTEIFGSTETGGVAYKRNSGIWTLYDAVKAGTGENGGLLVTSTFIDEQLELPDMAEFTDERRFILKGRSDRIVKFEEKRVSLPEIEQRIKDTGLVREAYCTLAEAQRSFIGACISLDDGHKIELIRDGKAKLIAKIKKELSGKLDPVTIPSKWRIMEELPVNAQGKIRKDELAGVFSNNVAEPVVVSKKLSEDSAELKLRFLKDSVYFNGHFPSVAILPGVVQTHFAIYWIKKYLDADIKIKKISRLKFVSVIHPGKEVSLLVKKTANGFSFGYYSGENSYSSGVFHV